MVLFHWSINKILQVIVLLVDYMDNEEEEFEDKKAEPLQKMGPNKAETNKGRNCRKWTLIIIGSLVILFFVGALWVKWSNSDLMLGLLAAFLPFLYVFVNYSWE